MDSLFLTTGRRNVRNNGALRLTGSLSNPPDGTVLDELLVAHGFSLRVYDGDASYDVSVTAPACEERPNGTVRCFVRGPIRVQAFFVPQRNRPGTWKVRVRLYGFADVFTGSPGLRGDNPLESPVAIELGTGSLTATATSVHCRSRGGANLVCR